MAGAVLEAASVPPRPRPAARWGRVTGMLASLGGRVGLRIPPTADLEARLAAGGPGTAAAGDVVALKAGLCVASLVGAGVLAPAAPGRTALVVLVAAPA